ncbi:3-phosphoshikimate 1-carboxyvinyltransferase, core domain protein, partial [mine drainage metagenome]
GETTLTELAPTRDHTERMLQSFGVELEMSERSISIQGGQILKSPGMVEVPGDISHAAFLLGAAALADGGRASILGVGLNPGRIGFLDVLERMGASVRREFLRSDPEPVGNVHLEAGRLRGVRIDPTEVPGLIDELPVIAALALAAEGETRVEGAGELRFKETDRILAL